MKIGTNDISKIYLGSAEVEAIYLGTEQVYGGSEPAEPYNFKLIDNQGNEYVDVDYYYYHVGDSEINRLMSNEGISPENIVELQIGDYATEVDIFLSSINDFYNVSGITVGKNVTMIRQISNAQISPDTLNIELQWIKLKCKSIPDISNNGNLTFEYTNCCPILVRSSLMEDYKIEWSEYYEDDCGAFLSERIDTYEKPPYGEQMHNDYITF